LCYTEEAVEESEEKRMPSTPRAEYDNVVNEMVASSPSKSSKMFGMPCLKNELGKAYAGFYQEAMVFKLTSPAHAEALALSGAQLFDPGMGRPMKEWVVVPADHAARWLNLAKAAMKYVDGK
jgi:hypothetical protein